MKQAFVRGKVLVGVVLLVSAAAASGAPISFTFSGDWTIFSSGPFGPSYVATIVFDNGGSSAANQVFGQSDFASATVVSGAYNLTMLASQIIQWDADFQSDASRTAGWRLVRC